MTFIIWSDDYRTGIYDIDSQHQKLFALVNQVHDNATRTLETQPVKEAIDALVDYVGYHFAFEEQVLEVSHYEELDSHKQQHIELAEKVETYRTAFANDPLGFDIVEFLAFLQSWLNDHILLSDMAYITTVVGDRKTA
jgi:hemerythrin-like metal-binding protein